MKRGSKTWKILRIYFLMYLVSDWLLLLKWVRQREKQILYNLIYMWNLKKNNLNSYKQSRLVVTRGE